MRQFFMNRSRSTALVALALLATAGWVAATTIEHPASSAKDLGTAARVQQTVSTAPTTVAMTSAKSPSQPVSPKTEAASVNYANELSLAFRTAADQVLPSVVMIQATPPVEHTSANAKPNAEGQYDFGNTPFGELFRNNPQFRQFFKGFQFPMQPGHAVASGSGVIIDPSGWILTNNHVVRNAGKVIVRLQDGREFSATDVHTDPTSDLAVMKIHAPEPLPAAKLGDSNSMQVGDWVLALGEPFGLQGTVTAGIISATGRSVGITGDGALLQTDAAINPGNSGGPLVNLNGQVIGIDTAISSQSGGNEGVGFAIPINQAKWVADQLVSTGQVKRAYLGAMIQSVTQELANQFGVKVHEGVLISQVMPKTPAAAAGLKPGDIVTQFAGKKMTSPTQLREAVEVSKVGSTEPLIVLRNGKELTMNVTLQARPKAESLAMNGNAEPGSGQQKSTEFDKLGMDVSPLTADVAEQLHIKATQGVVITEVQPNSVAALAGLRPGLVITQADGKPVKNAADLQSALASRPLTKGLLLLVQSGRGSQFVVLHPVG